MSFLALACRYRSQALPISPTESFFNLPFSEDWRNRSCSSESLLKEICYVSLDAIFSPPPDITRPATRNRNVLLVTNVESAVITFPQQRPLCNFYPPGRRATRGSVGEFCSQMSIVDSDRCLLLAPLTILVEKGQTGWAYWVQYEPVVSYTPLQILNIVSRFKRRNYRLSRSDIQNTLHLKRRALSWSLTTVLRFMPGSLHKIVEERESATAMQHIILKSQVACILAFR